LVVHAYHKTNNRAILECDQVALGMRCSFTLPILASAS